jgi:hypothetical protein
MHLVGNDVSRPGSTAITNSPIPGRLELPERILDAALLVERERLEE